ncbi:MAG: SDR family oxidoreductase [Acidimicrobiia bacterium]
MGEPPEPILHGRVALVTGAGSGIGAATARRLARAGASVCAVDLDTGAADAIARDVGGLALHADVGESAEVTAAFAACQEHFGGVDIVHLNAGVVTGHGEVDTLPDDIYRRAVRVNVDGVVFGMREAIPALTRRGGGAVVATASLAGIIPFALDPVYALTKHAVVGFVRSVAPLVESAGITVNTVNPGIVDTPMTAPIREPLLADEFPLLSAEEIADAVVTLATSGRTGECWVCQPGRDPEPYRFHDVPGPRTSGGEGRRPPGLDEGELSLD